MKPKYLVLTILMFLFVFTTGSVAAAIEGYLPTVATPQERLDNQIQKMITAGHLRTSYTYGPDGRYSRNISNPGGVTVQEFDDLFHNPADTIYTLAIAHKYVSPSLKSALETYLQSEFTAYPPFRYDHMGTAGARREVNDVPEMYRAIYDRRFNIKSATPTVLTEFVGWSFNPFNYYALYKYAGIFHNAPAILTQLTQNGHQMPGNLLADEVLLPRPHVLNSYIAGYYGYLGLLQLAGQPTNEAIKAQLDLALTKKIQSLPTTEAGVRVMSPYEAGGFLWLVPELGEYLNSHAKSQVSFMVDSFTKQAPYWMVPHADETLRYFETFLNEANMTHLYDTSSTFLAKAYALKQTQAELMPNLQNSTFAQGDLFYIQNLVATLEAPTAAPPPPTYDYPDFLNFLKNFTNIFDFNRLIQNL